MFTGPSTPIQKRSSQELRIHLIAVPPICFALAAGFAWAAFSLGWKWQGIVCGFASLWAAVMGFGVINGIKRELKRRQGEKTHSNS